MYSSSSSPTRALKDKQDHKYHLYSRKHWSGHHYWPDHSDLQIILSILMKTTCSYVYSGHHDPHNHNYPDQKTCSCVYNGRGGACSRHSPPPKSFALGPWDNYHSHSWDLRWLSFSLSCLEIIFIFILVSWDNYHFYCGTLRQLSHYQQHHHHSIIITTVTICSKHRTPLKANAPSTACNNSSSSSSPSSIHTPLCLYYS